MSAPAPKRAYHFTLDLHADDRAELAYALQRLADDVLAEAWVGQTSGGSSSGHHAVLTIDPEMSPERYQAALAEWMAARR
jgi:hypothetical protein